MAKMGIKVAPGTIRKPAVGHRQVHRIEFWPAMTHDPARGIECRNDRISVISESPIKVKENGF
jgi:hypothetical protein